MGVLRQLADDLRESLTSMPAEVEREIEKVKKQLAESGALLKQVGEFLEGKDLWGELASRRAMEILIDKMRAAIGAELTVEDIPQEGRLEILITDEDEDEISRAREIGLEVEEVLTGKDLEWTLITIEAPHVRYMLPKEIVLTGTGGETRISAFNIIGIASADEGSGVLAYSPPDIDLWQICDEDLEPNLTW